LGHGTVKTISADSFTAQDEARSRTGWSGSLPTSPDNAEPYFRSRITIDRLDLHDLPAQFRLSPGMPATAEIKIGKRTVLSYLLGHVVRVGSEGMREP
jgi:HlyD family secretion protein